MIDSIHSPYIHAATADNFKALNYAQGAMLKIFNILGSEHPFIAQYRTNLKRYILQ